MPRVALETIVVYSQDGKDYCAVPEIASGMCTGCAFSIKSGCIKGTMDANDPCFGRDFIYKEI